MSNEQKVQELISIFVCSKDHDIENFLRDKAILFEKLGKSRTFFVFDEATDSFQILGYFTLALQVLKIPKLFPIAKLESLMGLVQKRMAKKYWSFQ